MWSTVPYHPPVPIRRTTPSAVALTLALTLTAAIALVGCGSGGSEAKTRRPGVDRQAFYNVKGAEICVGTLDRSLDRTVRYDNSTDGNGNGPFPLTGNWCGTNPVIVKADVLDPAGTNQFRVSASNPEIGRPDVRITCRFGSPQDPAYSSKLQSFSDGARHEFACDRSRILVIRERDSDELKHFQIWVTQT